MTFAIRSARWAGALTLAAGLAAPAMAEEIRVALHADIASPNPGVNRDHNSDIVLSHVVEGLVAYGDDLSIQPMLAESWTSSDDLSVWEFKLREGVTFHDGAPLTAETVLWNFQRYADPETGFQCAGRYAGGFGWKITGIEAPDETTLRLTFDGPAPQFPILLATPQCTPWILSPSSVDAQGGFVKPVGTGPYEFAEMAPGRHVLLTRFADYAALDFPRTGLSGDKSGGAEAIRFMTVPDASSRLNGLQSGEIDLVDGVPPTLIEDLRARGLTIEAQTTPAWMMLQIQTRDAVLDDPRIRRAMAHAIDLDQLAAAVGEGLAAANPSIIPATSVYRDERTATWPEYSIEKARALLDEAGYDGEPIQFLVANRENRVQIATIVQAMLAQAGIDAPLQVRDWATQLDLYRKGDYQIALFAYSARLDPLLLFQSLIGDKTAQPTRLWEDPQAEALLEEVTGVMDVAERRDLFNQLHQLMAEQVPLMGLFNLPQITAAAPALSGYSGWPGGTLRLWGVSKSEG